MLFSNPAQAFWFAALAGWIFWSILNARRKSRLFHQWAESPALEKIFPLQIWKNSSRTKNFLRFFSLSFLILSATGPKIGQKLQEIKSRGSTLQILFDCSQSMLAEDFKPNRMEKAKLLLSAFLERQRGSRLGIIPFAGQAAVFCPITFDLTAAKQFLKAIEPGMIPQPGTRIGDALRLALSRLPESGSRAILLLTDGEDHKSDPLSAARQAKEKGVRIFAVGIGSAEGEPIPERDASGKIIGYKKNKKGDVVLSRLDEEMLSEMAALTGGAYFRASDAGDEIDWLIEKIQNLETDPIARKQSLLADRYQWFLFAALLFWIGAEALQFLNPYLIKRAGFFALFLIVSSLSSLGAATFSGKIREGNRFFQQEKYQESLESYEAALKKSPKDLRANFNKGCALYKLQNWDEAKKEFQKSILSREPLLRKSSLFNLGNSHFKKGEYEQAARAYQEVLKLAPKNEDARHNLKLALQMMKMLPPKQKGEPSSEKEQKEKQKSETKTEQEKRERQENAKRVLKSGAEEEKSNPLFKPHSQKESKKEYEEDW